MEIIGMGEEVVFNPLVDKIKPGVNHLNDNLTFTLRLNKGYEIKMINLVLRHEKTNISEYYPLEFVKEEETYNLYKCQNVIVRNIGLYWYHFEIFTNQGMLFVNKNNRYEGSFNGEEEFPLTVVNKVVPQNKEYLGGIIYHIFVDRFCKEGEVKLREGFVYRDDWGGSITKNTDDRTALNYEVFGGNLKGVISKLDYLESLGVTTIYLSPIFMAPSNHKYDTSNYEKIDPMFGNKEIFRELIDKAKSKNIGIILDGVFNHIGSDSIYFNKENKFNTIGAYNSKSSRYYGWFDFGNWPDEYRSWWGIKTLPSVNQYNKDLQNYLTRVIKHYMRQGIQGFRLDVVDEIQHELLHKICKSIYSVKKDALIIGEVWEDASVKIAYGNRRGYFLGEELNSVMNYPFKEAVIKYALTGDCDNFYYVYQMIENNYPEFVKHNLMNLIGSHDTRRIISILKEKDNFFDLLKIVTGLQFTFYGVPDIFYGDEAGLEEDTPDFSRKCYPWGKENQEILEWYFTLTKIRKYDVFKSGKLKMISCNDGVIAYKRFNSNFEIFVISNLSDKDYTYKDDNTYISLLDSKVKKEIVIKKNEIDILLKTKM